MSLGCPSPSHLQYHPATNPMGLRHVHYRAAFSVSFRLKHSLSENKMKDEPQVSKLGAQERDKGTEPRKTAQKRRFRWEILKEACTRTRYSLTPDQLPADSVHLRQKKPLNMHLHQLDFSKAMVSLGI